MTPRRPINRPRAHTFRPTGTAGRLAYFERQPYEDLTLKDAAAGRVEVVTVVRLQRSA